MRNVGEDLGHPGRVPDWCPVVSDQSCDPVPGPGARALMRSADAGGKARGASLTECPSSVPHTPGRKNPDKRGRPATGGKQRYCPSGILGQVAGWGTSITRHQHPFGITCYYQERLVTSEKILLLFFKRYIASAAKKHTLIHPHQANRKDKYA